MKLSEITIKQKTELNLIRGWAYVMPLQSGWNAAFEIANYNNNLLSDSIVKWLYRE